MTHTPNRVFRFAAYVTNLRGYRPALTTLAVGVALAWTISHFIAPTFPGLFFVYLLIMLAGGWFGYGPGIVVVLTLTLLVPYLVKPGFSISQVNISGEIMVLMMSLIISHTSAVCARAQAVLRSDNDELEHRVRARTSELAEANRALHESEQRFVAFMRHFPGAAWMKSIDGRYVFANDNAGELFGLPPGDLRGKYDSDVFAPELAEHFREHDRRSLEARGNLQTVEVLPGHREWLVTRFPILDGAGQPAMLGGVAVDVTDRVRTEQEVATLYEKLPVGLCLLDCDLRFLRVNEYLAGINGASPASHLGRRLGDMLPAGAVKAIEPVLRKVIETAQPVMDVEMRGRSISDPGTDRDWLIGCSPLKAPGGELLGIQVIVLEITERKRFESRLHHAAKLESLGILAGGIAHDFNNLLVGMMGNASLAQESVARDNLAYGLLDDVIAASERAADLTRQLLAYAGKGRFIIEPVDISQVVRETQPLISTVVKSRARVALELAEPLPNILADSSQIQQIVMNLVINAAEAVPERGEGSVTVRTSEVEIDEGYIRRSRLITSESFGPGRYVCLEVADTGSGMDQATLDRIFDPFFTTKFTGRGLGLAAVLGIVRSHHGALAVASAPGAGTTFRVLLPPTDQAPATAAESAAGGNRGAGMLVLIIDDEEIVRRTAQSALEHYGYAVLTADSGGQGVELFRRHSREIAAVVLDLTMPGMDGEQAFRELKKIRDDVCVVLSSGFDESDISRRFAGQSIAGFIQKPYLAAALVSKVAAVCLEHGREGNRAGLLL